MTDRERNRQPPPIQNIIGSSVGTNIIRGSWPPPEVDDGDGSPIQNIIDSTVDTNIIETGR